LKRFKHMRVLGVRRGKPLRNRAKTRQQQAQENGKSPGRQTAAKRRAVPAERQEVARVRRQQANQRVNPKSKAARTICGGRHGSK